MTRRLLVRLVYAPVVALEALQDQASKLATNRRPWVRSLALRWLGMDPKDPWKRPGIGSDG